MGQTPLLILESDVSPSEIRSLAAAVLAARESLDREFGLAGPDPVRLRVFENLDAFHRAAERWGHRRPESVWNRESDEILLPRRSTSSALSQILHWMVHRALAQAPAWMSEGLAELAAGAEFDRGAFRFDGPRPRWGREAREIRSTGRPLALREIPRLPAVRTPQERRRAGMFFHLIRTRFGPWPIRLLIQGARPEDLPRWPEWEEEERSYEG